MSELASMLAPREWAIVILFATFVMWTISIPETRTALGGLVHAFRNLKIVGMLGAAAVYIVALLIALAAVGLWRFGDTTATLFWIMTSAFVSVLNFQEAQVDRRYYRKAVREVFSLTTLFIYLTDVVELSLWFWLLGIPVMTVLHVMSEIAKRDTAHASAAKLLEWVQIAAGLILIYVVLQETIASWIALLTWENLRLLCLSVVLSIAFLPFIAVLTVYEPYERILGILPRLISDARLRRAARWRAALTFRTDTDFLERWRKNVTAEPPTSLDQLKESFAKLRAIRRRERNPQPVSAHEGWAPQSAIRFLEDKGLATNDYHELANEPGVWWAASGMTEFGPGRLLNNIAYYVYGTAEIATHLKLKVNVNQPAMSDTAMAALCHHARILVSRALDEKWQTNLFPLLEQAESFEIAELGVRSSLTRNNWNGGIPNGYDLTFEMGTIYLLDPLLV